MKKKIFTFLGLMTLCLMVFTQANAQVTVSSTATSVTCSGDSDGAIDITPTGGSGNYSFNWSTGATTEDVSNLAAGSYTVTITDDISVPFQFVAPNAPGNHTILIPPGTILIDGVAPVAGDYILVFYDSTGSTLGCGGVLPYTTGMTAMAAIGNEGGTNGFADNELIKWKLWQQSTGYLIDLNPTYDTTNPLFANTGNYADNGMSGLSSLTGSTPVPPTATHTATVVDPGLVVPSGVVTNASYSGATDGAIDVTVSGGNGGYTYLWNGGATTEDLSNLAAGTYTITVTDAMMCTGTGSFTVTEPSAVTLSEAITHVTCFGGTDGAIDLTVSGGTTPYTFDWSGGITTEDLTNIPDGTYNIVVTDAGGYQASGSYTVNQAAEITLAGAVTDVTCNAGTNGAIDVTVTNGVAALTYNWSNSAITEDLTGVAAGAYTLNLTDANGCTASGSWTVNEPAALALSLTTSDYSGYGVSTYGATDGTIDLTVTGGTAGFTYTWSNAETTEDLTALAPGTFQVTVSDANNCTVTGEAEITEPTLQVDPFVVTGASTNVTCYGACDGTINITPTGGYLPYTYIWEHGATAQNLTNLCPGTYTVTVADGTGSQVTPFDWTFSGTSDNHTILIPSSGILIDGQAPVTGDYFGVFYEVTGGGLACAGYEAYPGSVTAVAAWGAESGLNNGFAADEVFKWKYYRASDGAVIDLEATYSAPNLGAGVVNDSTYTPNGVSQIATLTGTSTPPAEAQTDTLTFVISEPTEIVIAGTETDVLCYNGNNGAINISVTGGSSPYTFEWSNTETTEDITGLVAGTYTISVTDQSNCMATAEFTINQPDAIAISGTSTFVSCNGLADGAIDLSVTGGTPAYTYSWANTETTEDLTNLMAGTYDISVYDANNCMANETFSIIEPAILAVAGSTTDLSCYEDNTGAIDLMVSGGTASYTYTWSNGLNTEDLTGLAAGTYEVTVLDANSCQASGSFNLNQPTEIGAVETFVDVDCYGNATGSITLDVTGGTAPYTYDWSNMETTKDVANLAAGSYSVVITDNNNCSANFNYQVAEPTELLVAGSIGHISCFGVNDGSVDITVTGGTAGYTYLWSNTYTIEDLVNLAPAIYNVTVSDGNNCTVTGSYTVTTPDELTTTGAVTDLACNNDGNGEIDLTVVGGTAPFTYAWTNSITDEDLSGLSGGTFDVVVTDAHNCQTSNSFTVVEPTALVVNEMVSDVICYGNNDGYIHLTINGGTPAYTYNWSNAETTEDISGLVAGNYEVTVSDMNGCQFMGAYTVDQPAELQISSVVSSLLCNGDTDGSIDATVSGGVTPYTYTWGNGASTEDLYNLGGGVYSLTVIDAHNCQAIETVTISEPAALNLTSQITHVSVLWGSDGAIEQTVTGGILPYGFNWNNGSVSEDLVNITAGTYNVTIADDNGCELTESYIINQPPDNPGWTYTNSGVNHTIVIPSTASLVVEGNQLIPGDYIGVFYDNNGTYECGGYMEYTGNTGFLAAWGDYSQTPEIEGFASGEMFTWKVWKAIENMEYDVNAVYMPIGTPQITDEDLFAANGMSGILALEDVEARQFIDMEAGWNTISSYVIEEEMSMDSIFFEIDTANIVLMKNEIGKIFWKTWHVNQIGDWTSEEGYQVFMNVIDTLVMEGEAVDPALTPVNLPAGWSLIGYLLDAPMDPATVFNPILPFITMVKDNWGHVYWPQFMFNNMGDMEPDQGYAVLAIASTSFNYVDGPANTAKSYNLDLANSFYAKPLNTGANMTVGIPVSAWENTPAIGDEIAVFTEGGLLVGSGVYANNHMAIAVWGDNDQTDAKEGLSSNERFVIKAYSKATRSEQTVVVEWSEGNSIYNTNDIAVAAKVSINEIATNVLGQNMPNPANDITEIEFSLANDALVELAVYNVQGALIEVLVSEERNAGTHKVQFDTSRLPAGTYLYKLRSSSFEAVKQMNVVR